METFGVLTECEHHDFHACSEETLKGGWKSAIYIIFVEFGERFAYYGVSGNLIMYLTLELNLPLATAAKNFNIWHGVSAIFPILGGFLADSFFGRFKTIVFSSITYLLGLALLLLSVEGIPLRHRLLPFFVALYVINIGEGGHRPCIQTFAADQFNNRLPKDKAAMRSFFNWWYLGIVLGATSSILVVIYVQDDIGWGWGFGIPIIVVALALAVFLSGRSTYHREASVGSPFTKVAQVLVAAYRKRSLLQENGWGLCVENGNDSFQSLALINQFRFLDKATIIDEIDISSGKRNYWRLCTVSQVEHVKLVVRLIPIWLSCFMFAVVIAQLSTFYTKQASTLVRTIGSTHFQLPPASLQVLPGLTILAIIPFYERLLIPITRRLTDHPTGITILQRIGFGIFFSILTMVVSAVVESRRVQIAREHSLMESPKSVLPMSVWWLAPQFILMGVSDLFTMVGLQELFYDQVPDDMRSMGAAAYLSVVGVGSFISSALIAVIQAITRDEWLSGDNLNKAHLDSFYWVLACLSGCSLVMYLVFAKGFVYK